LTPIIAHLIGAHQKEDVRPSVQQGLYLVIVLSAIVFLLLKFAIDPILQSMSLDAEVRIVAAGYLKAMSFGLIPLFGYTVLRSFFDALGATRVSMAIILISAPVNVCLNFLLIYGNWGFPELGGVGAAVASAITYWIVFFIACSVAWKWRPFIDFRLFHSWRKVSFQKWKEILLIGVPIGLSIFVETSIFAAVTLLMSNYSTGVISAHQIALNFTSLLYMIPLSISMGATILVGQEIGAVRHKDAKQYSYLSVAFAILFSFCSIIILLLFREQIASMYSNDIGIIKLAMQFFIFAALFQLSDAIQAPVQGALRGYKDVNMTFIMAIVSYWVLGLPIGYFLANSTDLGPFGYWVGLIVGLTVGAAALSVRLITIQKKKFN
jgi:MATE family multidrug resistance protein